MPPLKAEWPAPDVVVGRAAGGVELGGGTVAGLAVAGLSTSDTPPEASKPEPATTHRVADGQAAAFNAPVPARPWMDWPLEMAPVTGLSGTACPLDGSPASFPTARHCAMEGQVTALEFCRPGRNGLIPLPSGDHAGCRIQRHRHRWLVRTPTDRQAHSGRWATDADQYPLGRHALRALSRRGRARRRVERHGRTG